MDHVLSIQTVVAQAAGDPAGGAPTEDLIPALIVAVVATVVLGALGWAHTTGRFQGLRRLADWSADRSGVRGLAPWVALPSGVAGASLLIAVFGFYWDVSTHIDNGRDAGPFANPSHFFILAGLVGIALAGFLAVLIGAEDGRSGGIRIRPGWYAPVGGLLLVACGMIALAGFPLDDVWHRIFGQDVTLWGPTHIQMVAGASLATLAIWVLQIEGRRAGYRTSPKAMRTVEISLAGAFLLGLSTLQGEFDFGVPQFRLLYQPVLLALAASIGLVATRLRLGRGSAVLAVLFFLAVRGVLAVLIGPVLGRTMPHFPLLLVEALLVEGVASVVPRSRPLRLGALSGLAIGTVGLAAEWAWSHVWMPLPWSTDFLAEAVVWSIVAGVGGGVVGGLVGRALAAGEVAERPAPRWIGALAGAAIVAAIAWPLPTTGGDGLQADVTLRDLESGDDRTVEATIAVDPPGAADGHAFFNVTAWQGAEWGRQDVIIDELEEIEPGVWRTSEPIPVHGEWKALIRLHEGRTLAGVPIFMPRDEGIPADEIPAEPRFTRDFVSDKELLQREFTGGPMWLETLAYGLLLAIAVGWIWVIAWGLRRLLGAEASPPPAPPGRDREPEAVGAAGGAR